MNRIGDWGVLIGVFLIVGLLAFQIYAAAIPEAKASAVPSPAMVK